MFFASLRILGAALRAALGVVLLGVPAQTPSWLESIARLCINTQLYPNLYPAHGIAGGIVSSGPDFELDRRGLATPQETGEAEKFQTSLTWCFWTCCFHSWIYWISNVYYHWILVIKWIDDDRPDLMWNPVLDPGTKVASFMAFSAMV